MKKTIEHALTEASKILMENFGKINSYELKENQSSIVTQADLHSEKKIIEIITNRFPAHSTLGEETGFRNNNSNFIWIIDPLDGTSNFAAGVPWFGIIICVLKNFEPILAGCFLPVTNELYFAEKGRGSWLNDKSIKISEETELKNILASYSLDFSHEPGKTEREAEMIQKLVKNVRNIRSTNCLIDMCYTADSKFGACINQTTCIWDIAAPSLIISESGGVVTDIDGYEIDFSVNALNYKRNFTFVGSNKTLHNQIIKLFHS